MDKAVESGGAICERTWAFLLLLTSPRVIIARGNGDRDQMFNIMGQG
jgi:hypothetical protein